MKNFITYKKIQLEDTTNTLTNKHTERVLEINTHEKNNTQADWKTENTTTPKLNIGRKLTFLPPSTNTVSQKIQNFKRISETNKCVIGSGYCSGHNVKLERTIKMKKVSKIGSNRKLEWTMREVTSLACPAKQPSVPQYGEVSVMSQLPEQGTTNGKRRKLEEVNKDQPQPVRTCQIEREDTPLDQTT